MKKLLTVREVGELLQLNERTVLKMLQAGELPGIRIGNQWRIHPVVLEDWFLRRSSAAPQAAPSTTPLLFREELVLLNLPTTDSVERAVFGEGGVASAIRPPQLVIDFSTIPVAKCKAFAEMTELQWFLTEQVEEEKTAREWVAKFRLVGDDPGSLLDLDRELGARTTP